MRRRSPTQHRPRQPIQRGHRQRVGQRDGVPRRRVRGRRPRQRREHGEHTDGRHRGHRRTGRHQPVPGPPAAAGPPAATHGASRRSRPTGQPRSRRSGPPVQTRTLRRPRPEREAEAGQARTNTADAEQPTDSAIRHPTDQQQPRPGQHQRRPHVLQVHLGHRRTGPAQREHEPHRGGRGARPPRSTWLTPQPARTAANAATPSQTGQHTRSTVPRSSRLPPHTTLSSNPASETIRTVPNTSPRCADIHSARLFAGRDSRPGVVGTMSDAAQDAWRRSSVARNNVEQRRGT